MSEPLQHSPGPWTYDKIRCSVINGHDKPICEMTQYSYEGDMPLLLAAPDLLRLLREILECDDGNNVDGMISALWKAEQLIAKLDGQQP